MIEFWLKKCSQKTVSKLCERIGKREKRRRRKETEKRSMVISVSNAVKAKSSGTNK